MLDTTLLSQVQRHLIETPDGGATWSALWTAEEVLNYANQRQQKFLKETHCEVGIAEVDETAESQNVTLPDDWLATLAVLRRDADGHWSELPMGDTHQVDMGYGDTQTSAVPRLWVDEESPTLTARVIPAPATGEEGLLELYYIPMGSVFDGTGEPGVLSNEVMVCGIKWGIIADMLGKVGRGRDDSRIQWAEMRYEMTKEAVKMIMAGWF